MGNLSQCQVDRCLSCANPTCRKACPLDNDIPSIVKSIRKGDYSGALDIIGHPFGEICGYLCPHEMQCQGCCILGRKAAPVLVGTIERELFAEYPYSLKRKGSILKGKRYAVVGGGVSGLTFAAKVYEQGADVTVYERAELLSTLNLIPEFRLPRDAVLRVTQSASDAFNIVYEQISNRRLNALQGQFDGVYVSTGLTIDYDLGIDGQAFATTYRDCLKGNYLRGTVVIIGGGNSAMDCARLAKSQGSNVMVSYRRTEKDMPAFNKEIIEAKGEGVEFLFNTAPVKLCKNGNTLQLTLAKTVSEGRGKVVVTDEIFNVGCDSVIAAIGSKFDCSLLSVEKNVEQYSQYGNIYLGGDAKRGKLVVDAVSDGIQAARQIINNERKICL